MKSLVTVLIPAYNGQKYIAHMINSIISQDYRPLEIIVTDDASKDHTISVVNSCFKNSHMEDIHVKLIQNKKNEGLSGNISKAVSYIHGKYLFLADQDDIWKADKISRQIEYLENNEDCVMCICDRSVINADGKEVCTSLFRYHHAKTNKRNYREVMNSVALYPANCMCLRTEHLQDIFPIPRQIRSHDTFIAIMAAHYGKIGYVKNALTQYRIHGNNLSGQYALETNNNIFRAGFAVFKSLYRKKQIEINDTLIIAQELKVRFQENSGKHLQTIWGYQIRNPLIDSIRYISNNIKKWKRFCK